MDPHNGKTDRSNGSLEKKDDSSRTQSSEIQRRRMLGAALKRFSSTGYLGTKISDIAAEAGVSHGLVHHYFGSKVLLYSTVLEAGLTYLEETRRRALARVASPEDSLRKWVYSMIHCFDVNETYLFGRLVMQIMGAPDVHPPACIDALNRFTTLEVKSLALVVTETGKSEKESFKLSCLSFNTILGNKLIGMLHGDSQPILYETGCRFLGISPHPLPTNVQFPAFPWSLDGFAGSSDICKDN